MKASLRRILPIHIFLIGPKLTTPLYFLLWMIPKLQQKKLGSNFVSFGMEISAKKHVFLLIIEIDLRRTLT